MSLSRDRPSSRFLARYGLAFVGLLFVPRSQLHDMLPSERRAPEWQLVKDWPRLPTEAVFPARVLLFRTKLLLLLMLMLLSWAPPPHPQPQPQPPWNAAPTATPTPNESTAPAT